MQVNGYGPYLQHVSGYARKEEQEMTVYDDNIKLKSKIDWIAYYQIGGGILGAIFMIDLFSKLIGIHQFKTLILLIPILFYSFSIYAGYSLLKRKNIGVRLTFINQSLQIPQISILSFSYQFYAGLFLGIGIVESGRIGFNFSFSDFKFILDNNIEGFILMVNIVPIIIINRLNKYLEQSSDNELIIKSIEEDKNEKAQPANSKYSK